MIKINKKYKNYKKKIDILEIRWFFLCKKWKIYKDYNFKKISLEDSKSLIKTFKKMSSEYENLLNEYKKLIF